MLLDVFDRTHPKGAITRGGKPLRRPLGRFRVEWVYPLISLLTMLCRLAAGIGQCKIRVGS
jgi:hypothetical protein